MKGNQTQKLLHQAIEDLDKALGAGQSESLRRFLTAMARFHHYSLANMFLIMIQRPTATQVAGYRTWQKQGRQVKKGEKGIAILAPIVYRRKLESDHNVVTEDKVEEILTTFKTVFVFDGSQTEGRPLPELARVSGNPVELLPQLRDFVARKEITLRYSAALGGAEGLSTGRQIILKQGLPPGQEFSVLVHELAHLCAEFGYVASCLKNGDIVEFCNVF